MSKGADLAHHSVPKHAGEHLLVGGRAVSKLPLVVAPCRVDGPVREEEDGVCVSEGDVLYRFAGGKVVESSAGHRRRRRALGRVV